MEDTNAQPQVTPPPTQPGPTVAELQAQLDEMKRQSEGRLRDLQQERTRRQELEASMSAPASPAANNGVADDAVAQVINPYIAPVMQKVAATERELESLRIEKTQNYLSNKTGKSWEAIEADKEFQDKLGAVVRKYGIGGNVYDKTVRAYELLQLEGLKTKEEERTRAASAASAASLPTGSAPVSTSSGKRYSADEFDRLDPNEVVKMTQQGRLRKLSDGTFEYTPR